MNALPALGPDEAQGRVAGHGSQNGRTRRTKRKGAVQRQLRVLDLVDEVGEPADLALTVRDRDVGLEQALLELLDLPREVSLSALRHLGVAVCRVELLPRGVPLDARRRCRLEAFEALSMLTQRHVRRAPV